MDVTKKIACNVTGDEDEWFVPQGGAVEGAAFLNKMIKLISIDEPCQTESDRDKDASTASLPWLTDPILPSHKVQANSISKMTPQQSS